MHGGVGIADPVYGERTGRSAGGAVVATGRLREWVDEWVGVDVALMPDALLADTFIEVRREIERLESLAGRLLMAVEGRGIPYGQGATSVSAWAQWQTGQRWQDAKASYDSARVCER